MTNQAGEEAAAERSLLELIEGYRATAVLHVAARLGLADLLADGALGADELARSTGADRQSLGRLLRALIVLGILQEVAPGRVRLTPLGVGLRRDSPRSRRRAALRAGDEMEMRLWANLLHAVTTGETAFHHLFGMGPFDHLARNPDMSAAFNRAMVAATREAAPALIAAFDFSGFRTVVDVGGGSGAFLAALLQANPGMRGTLFDTREGVSGAAALLAAAGVLDRCRVREGDFFADELPPGAQLYLLKSVIDDWDDAQTVAILSNCRRAISSGGTLLVISPVMPDRIDQSDASRATVMFDLQMLVSSGGRQRMRAELEALYAAAGFQLTAVNPAGTEFPLSLVVGIPT
jgi:hypothetical protein